MESDMKEQIVIGICWILLGSANMDQSLPLRNQDMTVNGFSVVLQVPEHMRLEYVADLDSPRFITMGPDGELIIGSHGSSIYRVEYPYSQADTLVSLGRYIHSTAYREGMLYAADTDAVLAAPYEGAASLLGANDFTEVTALPSATGGHSSRTIVRGPDERLYVGLGLSGNCSDEYLDNSYPFERRRGGVFVLDNNNDLQPYSSGLRNPIGLAFHPRTNILYATNAGPDNLGYDNPPEVLARLSHNSFHGMPWFQYYDGGFKSGQCAQNSSPRPASDAILPAAFFEARSTPIGLAFLQDSSLGGKYSGSAVVAIHGSWAERPGEGEESRRPPKLSLVVFNDNNIPIGVEDMITGFQRSDGSRFARPCGVQVGADGHIYFTSDEGEVTGLFRLVPVVN
jgi:glucose/arabinose dehydrogenase